MDRTYVYARWCCTLRLYTARIDRTYTGQWNKMKIRKMPFRSISVEQTISMTTKSRAFNSRRSTRRCTVRHAPTRCHRHTRSRWRTRITNTPKDISATGHVIVVSAVFRVHYITLFSSTMISFVFPLFPLLLSTLVLPSPHTAVRIQPVVCV